MAKRRFHRLCLSAAFGATSGVLAAVGCQLGIVCTDKVPAVVAEAAGEIIVKCHTDGGGLAGSTLECLGIAVVLEVVSAQKTADMAAVVGVVARLSFDPTPVEPETCFRVLPFAAGRRETVTLPVGATGSDFHSQETAAAVVVAAVIAVNIQFGAVAGNWTAVAQKIFLERFDSLVGAGVFAAGTVEAVKHGSALFQCRERRTVETPVSWTRLC